MILRHPEGIHQPPIHRGMEDHQHQIRRIPDIVVAHQIIAEMPEAHHQRGRSYLLTLNRRRAAVSGQSKEIKTWDNRDYDISWCF